MTGPRADRATRAAARRQVAFVGHQLVEYGLAVALLIVAAEQRGGVGLVLAVVGGLLGVLALTAKSRLGAFRVVPLRVHHALDVVVALLCASSPAWALGVIHLPGSIAAEVMAALLLWMERLTSYRDRPRRMAPTPATTPRDVPPRGTVAHHAIHRGARQLGTATGVTRRLLRERARSDVAVPEPEPTLLQAPSTVHKMFLANATFADVVSLVQRARRPHGEQSDDHARSRT